MLSRRLAVASSPVELHDAMSPAPTKTAGGGGGGGAPVTVISELPAFPPAEADTVAWPAVTPLTSPVWLTVATAWFEVAHTNDEVGGLLVAESCTVDPACTLALDGKTLTDLTFADPAACCAAVTDRSSPEGAVGDVDLS